MPTAVKWLSRLLILLAVLAALGFTGVNAAKRWIDDKLAPVNPNATEVVTVTIPPGASTREVAERLHEVGLIKDPVVFRYYAQHVGLDAQLKPGEYQLTAAMGPDELLQKLTEGVVVVYRFTVREGLSVAETAQVLQEQGVVAEAEFLLAVEAFESSLWPAEGVEEAPQRLEGYLFPDTYEYGPDITALEVVAMMHGRLEQLWTTELAARAEEIGLTLHEVLTIASIIEAEAQVGAERETISGVYHNRLSIGMKLDADPTVYYAVGRPRGEELWLVDLESDSPYNTYRVAGLPPGPIGAPGLASIKAALWPEEHDYWYFVAKGDGTGEHWFAQTYAEHQVNVERYNQNRREE